MITLLSLCATPDERLGSTRRARVAYALIELFGYRCNLELEFVGFQAAMLRGYVESGFKAVSPVVGAVDPE